MKQVLLIHGAIGGADQLTPLQELLSEEFVVNLLEFEGHGMKSSIDSPFTIENFDRQLEQALSKIGGRVHVFGYSMGGFVALLHASKGIRQVASITTLGTKMRWSEEIANHEIKHLRPEIIKKKVPAFAEVLKKRHGEFWEEVLFRTADFMITLGDLQPIQPSTMERIEIPVQLCLADGDQTVSWEETQEVDHWISGGSCKEIPASQHPIEKVNLIALSDTIRSFIQSVD